MQELKELKTIINNNKGGTQVFTKYSVTVGDNLWNQLYSNIDNENYKQIAEVVCKESQDVQLKRRNHIRNLYNTYFTQEIFFKTLDKSGGIL